MMAKRKRTDESVNVSYRAAMDAMWRNVNIVTNEPQTEDQIIAQRRSAATAIAALSNERINAPEGRTVKRESMRMKHRQKQNTAGKDRVHGNSMQIERAEDSATIEGSDQEQDEPFRPDDSEARYESFERALSSASSAVPASPIDSGDQAGESGSQSDGSAAHPVGTKDQTQSPGRLSELSTSIAYHQAPGPTLVSKAELECAVELGEDLEPTSVIIPKGLSDAEKKEYATYCATLNNTHRNKNILLNTTLDTRMSELWPFPTRTVVLRSSNGYAGGALRKQPYVTSNWEPFVLGKVELDRLGPYKGQTAVWNLLSEDFESQPGFGSRSKHSADESSFKSSAAISRLNRWVAQIRARVTTSSDLKRQPTVGYHVAESRLLLRLWYKGLRKEGLRKLFNKLTDPNAPQRDTVGLQSEINRIQKNGKRFGKIEVKFPHHVKLLGEIASIATSGATSKPVKVLVARAECKDEGEDDEIDDSEYSSQYSGSYEEASEFEDV